MKIIAKECPKCGANLNFKVGDKEVRCGSCRRDFVIEYDHSKENPTAEDFVLDPSSQKMVSIVAKITAVIIFAASAVIMILSIIARQRMVDGLKDDDFSSSPVIIDER